MPTIFVLGPALDAVYEPIPVEVAGPPVEVGRRQIAFDSPSTTPGGRVHMTILPPLHPDDVLPLNIHAFYCQPVESVPAQADRTPDWFFSSSSPHGSIPIGAADADGKFTISVPGVKPSLQPYLVMTILEFAI